MKPTGRSPDTMLRRTWLYAIHDPLFQKARLAPRARDMAWQLAKALQELVISTSDADVDLGEHLRSDQAVLQFREHLQPIVQQSLTLQCELQTDHVQYEHRRFRPGAVFNPISMEPSQGPGGIVVATIFPGLVQLSPDGSQSHERVVAKAIVKLSTMSDTSG